MPTAKKTNAKSSDSGPKVYGYQVSSDAVVFEFDWSQSLPLVTDARTGERYTYQPESDAVVAVAGDFSDWQPQPMARKPRSARKFQLKMPRSHFAGPSHSFKFVVNERLWIEPPTDAGNTADAAVGDPDTRNLILQLAA